MTPERLNEIRERLDLYGGLDPLDTSDLIAEVERLRAGIEDIKARALDHRQIVTEGPLVGRILVAHWCDKVLSKQRRVT